MSISVEQIESQVEATRLRWSSGPLDGGATVRADWNRSSRRVQWRYRAAGDTRYHHASRPLVARLLAGEKPPERSGVNGDPEMAKHYWSSEMLDELAGFVFEAGYRYNPDARWWVPRTSVMAEVTRLAGLDHDPGPWRWGEVMRRAEEHVVPVRRKVNRALVTGWANLRGPGERLSISLGLDPVMEETP